MADSGAETSLSCNSEKDVSVDDTTKASLEDNELEDLLEDALQDFDKPALPSRPLDTRLDATASEPAVDAASGAKLSAGQPPSDVQAMESLLLSLMSGNTSDLESQFGSLNMGADMASGEGEADFADTLQRTLGNLAQSTQDLQNQDFSEESLMKLMTETLAGGDAEGAGEDEFMPMMQGMMKNLLSKDILYPSLKDISTKYPKWLEANRDQLPRDELERYERQNQMMATIISEFEAELPSDPEEVKHQRFERVLEVMQQMQELGQPPKELVGDPPKEFELDEDGFPKVAMPPFGGAMPGAEQCRLM